jgi:hypothetical protein
MTNEWVRRALTLASLLTVTALSFLPILFGLARTPLHDGDDVPGGLLLVATTITSVGVGVLAAGLLHRVLHPRGR